MLPDRFSSKDTRPGEDAWVDVIQLVDGHWTPNGEGLVVSDVAGQLHLYGMGSNELMAYSRYDQFFSSDYRPIRVADDGRVFDEEYDTEAHIRTDRCTSLVHEFYSRRHSFLHIVWLTGGAANRSCGPSFSSLLLLPGLMGHTQSRYMRNDVRIVWLVWKFAMPVSAAELHLRP